MFNKARVERVVAGATEEFLGDTNEQSTTRFNRLFKAMQTSGREFNDEIAVADFLEGKFDFKGDEHIDHNKILGIAVTLDGFYSPNRNVFVHEAFATFRFTEDSASLMAAVGATHVAVDETMHRYASCVGEVLGATLQMTLFDSKHVIIGKQQIGHTPSLYSASLRLFESRAKYVRCLFSAWLYHRSTKANSE